MKKSSFQKSFLSVLVLLASGCATLCPRYSSLFFERPYNCQAFLERLDKEVRAAGVRDSSTYCVPYFPYLRSDRFLAGLKGRLKTDGEREYWLGWMKELSLEARKTEIQNLPDKVILALEAEQSGKPDREVLFRRVESCSNDLLSHDEIHPGFYANLYPLVDVPDEYSLIMRTVGLYPLVSIPVSIITGKVRREVKSRFDADLEDLRTEGDLITFAPAGHGLLPEEDIEHMMGQSRRNPLQVPRLDRDKRKRLVAHFAPIFVQDVAASYDRFGRVMWGRDRLAVEIEDPTVYWYISHAFFKDIPVFQINYVIWYSRRAGKNAPWMERGHLDGLTVRVSLDTRGEPFMVDVMNNCGCYHFFSPEKERVAQVVSKSLELDPFVPQWLPRVDAGERLSVRANSGWHQVERLVSERALAGAVRYDLLPYEALESLPRKDGQRESMFDSNGIVKDSGRIEPFVFFSMGIPSVGSMRQRGHHAIALAGRTHFDEPFLFDRNFIFK